MIRLKVFIFALAIVNVPVFAEDYYYNREMISDQRFNKLYAEFKEYLFSDGSKVYDLRTGCTDRFVPDANALTKLSSGNSGVINAKISKVIDKKTCLLEVGKSIICVEGYTDTAGLKENEECSVRLSPEGTYSYGEGKEKKALRKFSLLEPVSKEIFKEYIKTRKLFVYKKVEKKVPAQTLLCPKCKGKGSYLKSKGKGKAGWVKCEVCKQKGTIPGNYKQQVTWEREDIE